MKKVMSWFMHLLKCGSIGLVFFMLLDIAMWSLPPHRGYGFWMWDQCGPVAVGDNYSLVLLTRKAHIFLAEYDQQIEVYGGTEREGKKLGNIDLHMNTGGRTEVKLLTGIINGDRCIQFVDRFGTETINLKMLKIIQSPYISNSGEVSTEGFKEIGTFSGESYPLKLIISN